MRGQRAKSILAVDFGSAHTRALLFDIVEGQYRLVARSQVKSSMGKAGGDLWADVKQILQDMTAATSREFLDQQGSLVQPERADRIGVDLCITTASAGHAIRTVYLGLLPAFSVQPARRAASPYYLQSVAEIHLEDGLSDRARINRISDSKPHLVFISGGTDGGARSAMLGMLDLLQQALMAMPAGMRPTVLYAGNSSLEGDVRGLLGQIVEVMIAPNIRPQPNQVNLEGLRAALSRYYHEHRKTRDGAYQEVSAISDTGILPSALGLETMAQYYARSTSLDVLAIDIGSANSQLSFASGSQLRTVLRGDLGLGQGAAGTLELAGEEAVRRWLPFHPRRGELAQYSLKKALTSVGAPLDMRERYIDYALLRAAIRCLLGELQADQGGDGAGIDPARLSLVITAGATLTGCAGGALDMMLLADALERPGVARVICDRQGALPALGALAATKPSAVVQLLQAGLLEEVGSLIRATGTAAPGKTALKLSIQLDGERIKREIAAGDLWHLPAPAGSLADVRIQAGRGVRVAGKRRLRLRLSGGRGGLLFDARLSQEAGQSITERAVSMLRWYAAATGESQPVMIPESWLLPPEEPEQS